MAADILDRLWGMEDIVVLVNARGLNLKRADHIRNNLREKRSLRMERIHYYCSVIIKVIFTMVA